MGWTGVAKVSCILRHQSVQLILVYNWARPAILVAGKGRRGMFLFLLFLHFHSFSSFSVSLSFISSTISFISFLPFSGRRHKMTHKGWLVVKPQHNKQLTSTWAHSFARSTTALLESADYQSDSHPNEPQRPASKNVFRQKQTAKAQISLSILSDQDLHCQLTELEPLGTAEHNEV